MEHGANVKGGLPVGDDFRVFGRTPLMSARMTDDPDLIALLLEQGANIIERAGATEWRLHTTHVVNLHLAKVAALIIGSGGPLVRSKLPLAFPITLIPLIGLATIAASPGGLAGAGQKSFEKSNTKFFGQYCAGCHNAKAKAGGLNLEAVERPESASRSRGTWGKYSA